MSLAIGDLVVTHYPRVVFGRVVKLGKDEVLVEPITSPSWFETDHMNRFEDEAEARAYMARLLNLAGRCERYGG